MQMDKHKEEGIKCGEDLPEIKTAIDYGIDISMLKDNLERSPAELIRRHQVALDTAKKLRKAEQKKPF